MDSERFDALVRDLSARSANRRRLGRGVLVATALSAIALLPDDAHFGGSTAGAAGSKVCKRAQPTRFISLQACETLVCGSTAGCLCAQTVGHVPTCVSGFDPANQAACPTYKSCKSNNNCPAGQVCAKVDRCCGDGKHRCLPRCPA